MDYKDYIIQNTAGNLYWKDRQGRYLGCNKEYADMIGLDKPEDIIGKSDNDLFLTSLGKERLNTILEIDQIVIKTGETKIIDEIGVDSDKNIAHYITKKVPLKDKNGEIIGLVGTSLNITKEKQAEIAKREFLENMSHDLRTPFSGILSLTEYMYGKETDPTKKEFLGEIMKSGKWLLTLLNEVLEMSMLGSHPLNLTDFSLLEVVNQVAELLRAAVRHKGLDMNVLCPEITIHSDRMRVTRILLNLLGNAVKYTNEGSISIKVNTNSPLQISVEDTGKGIPADGLETIFNRFTKICPSYEQQEFSGTGVGLHIAREFARDLGGDITVSSEVGKGSTFTVTFI